MTSTEIWTVEVTQNFFLIHKILRVCDVPGIILNVDYTRIIRYGFYFLGVNSMVGKVENR